jgi:shikimate dehydrogenase
MLGVKRLTIFDVDGERANALAARLGAEFDQAQVVAGTDLTTAVAVADGVINATPVGMANHPGLPLPSELLRPALWVSEIVYFPLETALLRAARGIGCRTLDGGGMAVFQAIEAFRLFTGIAPDAERMLHCFSTMTGAVATAGGRTAPSV